MTGVNLVGSLTQAIKDKQATKDASSQDISIQLYYPGSPEYDVAVEHYIPNGISEFVEVAVEPGSEFDMSLLMGIVSDRRIPFALKCAGNITNPKYNKEGILIYMGRFNLLKYNEQNQTIEVGAGVTWNQVYTYLKTVQGSVSADRELGIVGGEPIVGVTGFLLGGGYSLLTNRFGLGIDNIVEMQVVLPGSKGTLCNVSATENPELFKALKGGAHNFGIITKFTLRVHEHGRINEPVYQHTFDDSERELAKDIMVGFIQSDPPPEAVMLGGFRYDLKDGNLTFSIPITEYVTEDFWTAFNASRGQAHTPGGRVGKVNLAQFFFSGDGSHVSDFHDSVPLAKAYEAFSLRRLPVPLDKLQDEAHFTQLDTSLEIDGKTFQAGDLIAKGLLTSIQDGNKIDWSSTAVHKAGYKAVLTESDSNHRGRLTSISVATITRDLIDEVENQAKVLSLFMKDHQGTRISFDLCQLHKDAFNGVKREDSAWPHEAGKVFGPLVGQFEWTGAENDQFWLTAIENAQNAMQAVASKLPENRDLPKYLNEALDNTTVEDIYRDNLEHLKLLRQKYDQDNVMGLAEGFVIKA